MLRIINFIVFPTKINYTQIIQKTCITLHKMNTFYIMAIKPKKRPKNDQKNQSPHNTLQQINFSRAKKKTDQSQRQKNPICTDQKRSYNALVQSIQTWSVQLIYPTNQNQRPNFSRHAHAITTPLYIRSIQSDTVLSYPIYPRYRYTLIYHATISLLFLSLLLFLLCTVVPATLYRCIISNPLFVQIFSN